MELRICLFQMPVSPIDKTEETRGGRPTGAADAAGRAGGRPWLAGSSRGCLLALLTLIGGGLAGQAATTDLHPPVVAPAKTAVAAPVGDCVIDDEQVQHELAARGEELMQQGKTLKASELAKQLDRKHCALKLPNPTRRTLKGPDLVRRCRPGVVVVGQLYKCPRCSRWHAKAAAGFLISVNGAFVTCYHVVTTQDTETFVIMTPDGRVAPVVEVLAANKDADLAILRAEGSGFPALPVSTAAPAGSTVWVLSHPDTDFYLLTQGIVSRYYVSREDGRPVTKMGITAEFARGSSGAPVLNEAGAVVGVVQSTRSVYYTQKEGQPKEDLQIVIKQCVPAREILELAGQRTGTH